MRKRAIILWLLSALLVSCLSLGGAGGVGAQTSREPTWSYQTSAGVLIPAISNDGSYIATVGNDYIVRLFDKTGALLWSASIPAGGTYTTPLVSISSDGNYIAATTENYLYFFSRTSSSYLWYKYLSGEQFLYADVSSNGSYIALKTPSAVYLYTSGGSLLWKYSGTFGSAAISADGNYVVVGSYSGSDSRVYLFDRLDNIPEQSYWVNASVLQVDVSSNGDYFVATDINGKVYFFDHSSSIWTYQTGGVGSLMVTPAISSDGNYVAAGAFNDNKVYLFNRSSGTPLWSAQVESPFNVSISETGDYIAVGRYSPSGGGLSFFSRSSSTPLWSYQLSVGDSILLSLISLDDNYIAGGEVHFQSGTSVALAASNAKLHLFTTNATPTLTSGSVSPTSGSAGTTFTYEVTYTDADGDAPSNVFVFVDGVEYNMTKISGTYAGGTLYRLQINTLTTGSHSYYFETSDSRGATARLPTSGTLSEPTVGVTNNSPTLTSGSVSPSSGTVDNTFTYEVTYTDADGDTPSYVYVYIDGSAHSMSKISGTYTGGATYRYNTSSLSSGSHTYYFETSDGTDNARLPTSGTYSGPTVTAAANNAPTLSSVVGVVPSSGATDTTFIYQITYADADGDAPSYVYVYIDGTGHSMSMSSGTYSGGAVYSYTTSSLSSGSHIYYFTASDGTDTARYPATGENSGPTVSFSVALTFTKPDGSALTNTMIYYGTSQGAETSYLGTTDSYGRITSSNSTLAGTTVYFKSSDGVYSGSTYVSSSGGSTSASLAEVVGGGVSGGAGATWAIVAVVLIVIGVVGGGLVIAWKKGLLAAKPKPAGMKAKPSKPAKLKVKPKPSKPAPVKPAGVFCPHCKLKLPADAEFCPECGRKVKG